MIMAKNKTRPTVNNHLISDISLTTQRTILNDKTNITFPINLHRTTVSYFSLSSLDFVLNPAIKKEPFPFDKVMPSTANNKIIIIVPTIFIHSIQPRSEEHTSE